MGDDGDALAVWSEATVLVSVVVAPQLCQGLLTRVHELSFTGRTFGASRAISAAGSGEAPRRIDSPCRSDRRALDDVSREFGEPTPGASAISERVRRLLAADQVTVLLGGAERHALVVLRFRPALFSEALDCYVEELYVAPARRRRGLGRKLMEAAIELARRRGAARMDLGTGEDDTAARALYERLGLTNRGGRPDGPINLFCERDL